MEERRTTTVVINNAEYRIVCEADEEYVRHVAYHVDKKMRELLRLPHFFCVGFRQTTS